MKNNRLIYFIAATFFLLLCSCKSDKIKVFTNENYLALGSPESLEIPMGYTHIEDNAFYMCMNLKSIYIPSSVRHIGRNVFLFSSVQPNNITLNEHFVIENGVMYNAEKTHVICSFLSAGSSVTIPETVTHIEAGAFYNNLPIRDIHLPNSVKHIGDEAFCECEFLYIDALPDSLISIGTRAFYGVPFSSITIPSKVTTIGERAFAGNSSLYMVNLPNSVDSIGELVFGHCPSLQSIYIPTEIPIKSQLISEYGGLIKGNRGYSQKTNNSEVTWFRVNAISFKEIDDDENWGEWSEWIECDISIQLTREAFTVFSSEKQVYKIDDAKDPEEVDDGGWISTFYCIDKDGGRCHLRLRFTEDLNFQLYVDYNNIMYAFDMLLVE